MHLLGETDRYTVTMNDPRTPITYPPSSDLKKGDVPTHTVRYFCISVILHPPDKMFSFFLPRVGFKGSSVNMRTHFIYFKICPQWLPSQPPVPLLCFPVCTSNHLWISSLTVRDFATISLDTCPWGSILSGASLV